MGLRTWQLQRVSLRHFLQLVKEGVHDCRLTASFQKRHGMQFGSSIVCQAPTGWDSDRPVTMQTLEELKAFGARCLLGPPLLAGEHCRRA